jgi:hypothetical protein
LRDAGILLGLLLDKAELLSTLTGSSDGSDLPLEERWERIAEWARVLEERREAEQGGCAVRAHVPAGGDSPGRPGSA